MPAVEKEKEDVTVDNEDNGDAESSEQEEEGNNIFDCHAC